MPITYINDYRAGYPEPQVISISVVETSSAPVEPVQASDLAAQVRVDYNPDEQETLMSTYCSAAREWCETWLSRSLMQQTLMMTMDYFPLDSQWITLRRPPVNDVLSVEYYDANGDLQTLDPSLYQVDYNDVSPRIVPKPIDSGTGWPTTNDQIDAVFITYTVGYSTIPAVAKATILLVAADLWNNREGQMDRPLYKNATAEALLSTIRTF